MNLRVSYAGGYRAPQAFDEDMHIAIVGGKRVRIRLADDLKEERSHSVSLSADLYLTFGSVQANLLVEGFYTKLVDVFALRDIEDTADGGKIKERYNGSGATVRGLNAEGRAAFTRWFELQAGMTWQRSRYPNPSRGARMRRCLPCAGCSARPISTAISPRRSSRCAAHGRRDRNLHGGDARAAHGRIGGGPGCGGHHAGVLRREPAAGL